MEWASVPSPIGPLGVAADGASVTGIRFAGPPPGPLVRPPVRDLVAEQLAEYFAGSRTDFTLPLAPPAGSAFDRAIWAAIAAIPYGETATYGALAAQVGQPDAARAVGVACHRNPVPIVVACHRVVGAGGKLVGFGGGLSRKRVPLEPCCRGWIAETFTNGSTAW